MDPEALVIRPWRPGDEEAINAAFNAVFALERPLEEWRWKFQRSPIPSPIMVAWSGDELLAHYAGVPARFQVGGRVVWAAQIVDVFSTPRARKLFARRGVYIRTAERFFEVFGGPGRFSFIYGFPGRRALRLGILQLGYGAMEPEPVMVWTREAGGGTFRLRRLPYRARPFEPGEAVLDRLWERLRWRYPCAVVRDREWIQRRLSGRPGVSYLRFLLLPRMGTEPVGWVVFRTDGGVCRWVDLLWDPGHPGALALAAHLGARLAATASCGREELWLVGDPHAAEVLASLGYRSAPERHGLVFTTPPSFDPAVDVRELEGRVYLTMADSDLV